MVAGLKTIPQTRTFSELILLLEDVGGSDKISSETSKPSLPP